MTAPLPPPNIASRTPERYIIAKGQPLHRFHTYGAARHSPIYFDTSRSGRLNAPDARYGVLYTAQSRAGAFAESFLRNPGNQTIDRAMLALKANATLQAARDLKLALLTGPGLAILGATAEVTHGGLPYDAPQSWSAALHDHAERFDGIAYRARHDDAEICYALFDRCSREVVIVDQTLDLNVDWFWDLADRYGVGLAP